MASMNFGGISTGIPTDQMIEAILFNERLPIDRLQTRQTANNQKKSALTAMKTAFSNLATSIASLTSAKLDGRAATSSDPSGVTVTASAGASGSYDLVVKQLATKARVETNNSFASPNDSVGSAGDSYTIVGKDGNETKITLEDGKTSLADLNSAINAKSGETGVSANIVQKKPGEYHLVLSSTETGVGKNGGDTIDTIGIYGETGNALGVGDSAGQASAVGVTVTERAKNAVFTLDGVEMERASNTVSDAVDGVAFTLNKADNKTINLKVSADTDSVVKAFQDVVSKYNAAMQTYKNNSGNNGVFSGDLMMQSVFSQLRSSITGSLQGEDGQTWSSAILGMSTNKDGTLSLDAKKLEEAIKSNPDAVGKVFDKMSSDTKTFIDGLTTSGGGTITTMINSIDTMNSNLTKQIDTIQARLDRRKEALTAQFARLEGVIGQMQAAGQSLSGLYYS